MGLTKAQQDLYDRVLGDDSGRDLLDVLRDEDPSVEDKRAVADAFGGPGSGQRDF
jgi:hypothetical protein